MACRTRLDEDGCIDLLSILQVVNQIDQEQAWAICYEICTLMKRLARCEDNNNHQVPAASSVQCAPIESLGQVHIHKDGHVHEKSCLIKSGIATPELSEILKRRPAINESELVASLGIALFWALDYGIPNDEERQLSIAMEYLIFQSQSKLTFDEVAELCIKRLPPATRARPDSHYREVCKSLVQDTIQLSIFLEKIYTASMVLGDISEQDLSELGEPLASLRALKIDDWARLWMHVIKELKQALAIT